MQIGAIVRPAGEDRGRGQSFVGGLYLVGCVLNGICAPVGTDPDADITGWNTRLNAGEPYDGDPAVAGILDEIKKHHSSFYIDHSEAPAPMLISNGWTDDLFPADEAIRFYNRTRSQYPEAPVSLFFMDFGHMRGQNKGADVALLAAREEAWFDHYIKGTGADPYHGIETLTQTCPKASASGGPFFAKDWGHVSKGEVRLGSTAVKSIEPTAGDPAIGNAFDPVSGPGACAQASAADQAGTATYRLPVATGTGYTLMGSPTVVAEFKLTDSSSQVAARLLDVGPDGKETLVDRGLWRPKTDPGFVEQVFQLHPNGWHFDAGHIAKLELLPNDAPYGRASNGQKVVKVRNLPLPCRCWRSPAHSAAWSRRSHRSSSPPATSSHPGSRTSARPGPGSPKRSRSAASASWPRSSARRGSSPATRGRSSSPALPSGARLAGA